MPFRPLSNPERVSLLAQIEEVEKAIRIHQGYLASLRGKLEEGVWFADIDYSKLHFTKRIKQ